MEVVRLAHPSGATAEVHRQGAHVTSWVPAGGGEALFLSRASRFGPGTAIRGGVPVIFPQFAEQGPLPKHGFARKESWQQAESTDTRVVYRLRDSTFTRAIWPHAFSAELTVELEERRLSIRLSIGNTGRSSFSFTGALHTYLRVADVGAARVSGLRDVTYVDKVREGGTRVDGDEALRITGEVDRVYLEAPSELVVHDEAGGRMIVVRAEGFTDAVIWNPGPANAAALPDMEEGEEREMLCVEAAQASSPVTLEPGESWTGTQVLEIG